MRNDRLAAVDLIELQDLTLFYISLPGGNSCLSHVVIGYQLFVAILSINMAFIVQTSVEPSSTGNAAIFKICILVRIF
ncbi:hypothetical protein MKQ70_14380 [Chitinophaga sedimenti]|uniref:hypothetical protein n=1 Tax=Chitinophaga sedimenti TaxID=2033606 RepID=UPI002002B549|nr:hypothetical protein [Chitinophaga sedimenti]MCK7556139.1 hypothetical protein [Chitinophaga sedimenti]